MSDAPATSRALVRRQKCKMLRCVPDQTLPPFLSPEDFGAIAREMGAPEAESFVARIELEAGAHVLDIACSETQPKIRSEQQSRPSGQNRDWPINPRVY